MENKEIEFLTEYYELLNETHGEINYQNYGAYIFSLFFLRYVNCKFNKIYCELVEEGYGFEEDIDEYLSADVFFIPPEARWEYIVKNCYDKEISVIINHAMKYIEYSNKYLTRLTKELNFIWYDRLVNCNFNIVSLISLINDEKTEDDYFWFKILKRIYMDMAYYEKPPKFVILDDIIYDLEYFNQYYDFEWVD